MLFNSYLTYIAPGSILVPLLLLLFRYKTATVTLKILFWYLIVAALTNLAANILAGRNQSNLWLLHVFTIIETALLLFFFYKLLPEGRIKKALPVLMIVFPLYGIVNLLVFNAGSRFNTYPRSLEALLFIILSLYYWFPHSSEEAQYHSWSHNIYNWIISGIILYFASSFFLFLFSNFLLVHINSDTVNTIWNWAWGIHATLVMSMYLLFAIGISKCR